MGKQSVNQRMSKDDETKGYSNYVCFLNSVSKRQKLLVKLPSDSEMEKIIEDYSDVFRLNLPNGLPSKRIIDYEIETDPSSKIPNRRLFRASAD